MSTYDYTSIYNTAVSAITKFGAEYTLKRVDTTNYTKGYNPVTSSDEWVNNTTGVALTSPPYNSTTADGVVGDFTQEERYNTSIKLGDKKLYTVTIDAPQAQDIFVIGTTEYSYINHETVQPASDFDPLLYKIQLRV